MELSFFGGAGGVSGVNYLLTASDGTNILVDCGLFQGKRYAAARNFERFSYEAKAIHAVFVTHAHIDHTGRLPKLVAEGFKGPVYSTAPTRAVSRELLDDSRDILSREAAAHGAANFCTPEHLEKLFGQWETVRYHEPFVHGPFTITYFDAGHILGSAFIRIEADGTSITFSGDLGNSPAPLITEREPLGETDYCLVESTYGGRVHEPRAEIIGALEDIVEETVRRNGTLLIPAFAMERTQELLFHLQELMVKRSIPDVPVYLDSPLAIRVTSVYEAFRDTLDAETKRFLKAGNKLFGFPTLKRIESHEQSLALWNEPSPKIIIAGAGMSHGGRIVHHEQHYLPDASTILLLVSFQAEGTSGRALQDGVREVTIGGRKLAVKASVRSLPGYSAHADEPQLLDWLRPARFALKRAFVVQGEMDEMQALSVAIEDKLAVATRIPKEGETVILEI